ncbi:MAG: hypothetical protein QXO37_08790 [Candidatus Nitrosocaldaceae archaeon]
MVIMQNTILFVIIATAVVGMLTLLLLVVTVYAISYYDYDHVFKENMSILARIELTIESFLHYARDYTSIAVSFLIKQIEEEVVSKHKDSSSTSITYTISIQVIEDKHYTKNELITIRSKAIIEEVEGEGEESKEEKREGEYI